jgi:tol-pal system protein YbgF
MQKIRHVFLVVICLFLASCVTSQSEVDSLSLQLKSLERKQQREMQDMTQKLQEYRTRLETVAETRSEAEGSVQTTQATLWADVESIRVQVATLTGRLDSLERQYSGTARQSEEADRTLRELKAKTAELDRSMHMISSQLGLEIAEARAADDPGPPADPGEERKPPPAEIQSTRALYQRALDSFYDRDYELAQSLWEEFTDNFPEHALTSNAYFWQGESFYQMQEYAQAALAYQEVISSFPDSNKMVSSMLKQGMSFFRLGRKEAGELVLEELIKKHPDTAEARRAKAFMADYR